MRLAVLLSSAVLLAFGASHAFAGPKLEGTSWVMSSAGKRVPSISFGADGKVAGSGGCNRFFGGYRQDGEALSFSTLGSTRMACPQEVMRKEQAFFALLKAVRSAKVEGAKLVLRDGAGKALARLSRRD
jgi:heat shock protein HslJ